MMEEVLVDQEEEREKALLLEGRRWATTDGMNMELWGMKKIIIVNY